jgi:hypothetical protein
MITLSTLKEKFVSIVKTGHGHWRVTFKYAGKDISCTTTNALAVDAMALHEWERRRGACGYSTCKQGYMALYDECKRANGI